MITENKIEIKLLKVKLSVKTSKCEYAQVYDLSNKKAANYVPDIEAAKQRFMEFYNQFE